MQIHFTGHQIEVTDALRTFTEEKLQKLKKHFDRIINIHVTFHVEKLSQIVEATILVSKAELHAKAESENMYAAVDDLIDKLDRQLIKHKEKQDSH